MVIDGHGDSHIIAAFLLNHKDGSILREMIKIFKTKNPLTPDTRIILTDKDMIECNIFKTELPHIHLQICLFHIPRIFGRECTVEK